MWFAAGICGLSVLTGSSIAFAGLPNLFLDRAITNYWNGLYEETIDVLTSLTTEDLSYGEKLDYHKYLAFSYVALGSSEQAEKAFVDLLSADLGYRLDPDLVSPKIIGRFDQSKQKLAEAWLEQGKTHYRDKDYRTALKLMDMILELKPEHRLAREYKQLSDEQIALTRTKASMDTRSGSRRLEAPRPDKESEKVYRLSSKITPPVLVTKVAPRYPPLDIRQGKEGRVVLAMNIEKDGSVGEARILRSAGKAMDRAAVSAVKRWKYRPALLDGKPVMVSIVTVIAFALSPP